MKFMFNPFAMWFLSLSADELMSKQLHAARIERARHAIKAEFHKAQVKMLDKRIKRLDESLQPETYEGVLHIEGQDDGALLEDIAKRFKAELHGGLLHVRRDNYVTLRGVMSTITIDIEKTGFRVARQAACRVLMDKAA